ncbi:MAG: prolyl aminopeptidase [Planctomycetes bacterium]|jgi:proline iminopeptidase|nr:prolyl aminopeptidase [Planctomycetota bacterium]
MAPPGLYPPLEPFHQQRLPVSPLHTLHVEQCGNPAGAPVLFVHGGPGAGCSATDRRFFDPNAFRVVLVDQRGAGRSTPLGELAENTIDDLVADFELVRERLGIERWHVFGGSWGSTLGLYYAQRHPDRVLSLCLRGIWLLRQLEVDWWLYDLRAMAPELWRAFAEHLPAERRHDLLEGYWELFHDADPQRARAAAKAWATYEGAACTLLPNPEFLSLLTNDHTSWALARLEAHYLRNQRFTPDDRLLRDVDRIRHLPAFLVHGRYDLVCPLVGADDLHRAWPEASYVIVDDAGHSSHEPGIARQLVAAMDRVARTGSPRL